MMKEVKAAICEEKEFYQLYKESFEFVDKVFGLNNAIEMAVKNDLIVMDRVGNIVIDY